MTAEVSGAGPTALPQLALATGRLLADVDGLDDNAVGQPSALPGWRRAHVLTHLARHAEALVRIADAARRGELVDPYPGGPAGRAAEIEQGAGRTAEAIRADVAAGAARLAEKWRRLPADVWNRPTKALKGTRPLAAGVTARWVEVEVHHVDLRVGRSPAQWSPEFVTAGLGYVLAGLPGRPGPATAPGSGRWLLWCPERAGGWQVDATGSPATVRPVSSPEEVPAGAHRVDGAGHDVLAWLLGRRPAGDGLRVRAGSGPGDPLSLPALFPFP